MKITSVICEYNPFHRGHAYQLAEMKKRGAVVAIMSGSFTQRGTPAVLMKYDRARAAIYGGADLVLELPYPYSAARADIFGAAGVRIASALGCVDELCFGSETGELDTLCTVDARLASDEFREALDAHLAQSRTHAHRTAIAEVYAALYGEDGVGSGSNDILALSYLAALREQKSHITPVAIRRVGERYDGSGEGYASATSIRGMLMRGELDALRDAVPEESARLLTEARQAGALACEERLYALFAMLMRTGKESTLFSAPDVPPDLAARMVRAAQTARDTESFLLLTQSRQFSPSRVRRAMLYAVMGTTAKDISEVCYTTVLAANATGRRILAAVRKSAAIAVITKPADAHLFGEDARRAFSHSAAADGVWELLTDAPRDGDRMIRSHPVMIDPPR